MQYIITIIISCIACGEYGSILAQLGTRTRHSLNKSRIRQSPAWSHSKVGIGTTNETDFALDDVRRDIPAV